MIRSRSATFWVGIGCLALVSCAGGETHEDGEHHDHGGQAEGLETPTTAVTLWTAAHELFMEHPLLVVGSDARFAIHVTLLPSFKAATQGSVTVSLTQANGTAVQVRADAPRFPGIFGATVRPTAPGLCRMVITIDGEVLPIPECQVYPDQAAAIAAAPADEGGGIPFLKEQQWTTDFATMAVQPRQLQPGVLAHGEIQPVAGKEARLSAATAGRLQLADPVPVLGMPVRRGQVLATVLPALSAGDPASLDGDVLAARSELEAAGSQLARAERLSAEGTIPERQVEEARTRAAIARARLSASEGRLQQYRAGASGTGGGGRAAFQVRSPIDGTLVATEATAGQTIDEGDPLFTVVDLETVWLKARVFEPDIPRVEGATAAWFTVEGYEEPFTVDSTTGRLVTVGRVIDPASRTVPVIFEVANPGGRLRIGQFTEVTIAAGAPITALAVPESALIEEAGRAVVYVQQDGESFTRRPLTIGLRAKGWVEVREGLREGERVVTRGAYEIKLASSAGSVPAHGHVH